MAKSRLKSPRARLFVALELPDSVRAALADWQERELADPALRAVRAQALHVTLVFLGYRAEKEIERVAAAALVEHEAPEMRLEPEPVGVPRGRRPRLFALDAPSPGAVALQAEVEGRLVEAGLHQAERRPFWPHVTVARVRPAARGARKPAQVERPPGRFPGAEQTFPPFRPTRLVLFRSNLRPTGAEYEPMAERELPDAS